jgi:predicted RNA binding protein YcfA (HicA-like mRNA interferase family)
VAVVVLDASLIITFLGPANWHRAGITLDGTEATMPRKVRQLRADLRRAGWGVVRQFGSHQIWKHPLLPGVEVNLAGQDGADAPITTRSVTSARPSG